MVAFFLQKSFFGCHYHLQNFPNRVLLKSVWFSICFSFFSWPLFPQTGTAPEAENDEGDHAAKRRKSRSRRNSIATGMFLRSATSTSLRWSTRQCRQLDRSQWLQLHKFSAPPLQLNFRLAFHWLIY